MRKNITITIALLLALAGAGTVRADQAQQQSPCAELQQATANARARWMAEDLAMREQTVMLPPPSVSDLSCLDSYTLGVDVGKYDPAAVAEVLVRQAKQQA